MIAGHTFFLKAAVYQDGHLWIAAYCDPKEGLIMVNMTTDMSLEQTCILNPGEHEFVTVKTLIAYEYAQYRSAAFVPKLEAVGIDKKLRSLKPDLLTRVQNGILKSRFTSERMKALVDALLKTSAKSGDDVQPKKSN